MMKAAALILLLMPLVLIGNDEAAPPSVFELPRRHRQAVQLTASLVLAREQGEIERAEQLARTVIQLLPGQSAAWYNLASVLAAQEARRDDAFAALEQAIELGWRAIDIMEEAPELARLRADDRWQVLLHRIRVAPRPEAPEISPAVAVDGVVHIEESNTTYTDGYLLCHVAVDAEALGGLEPVDTQVELAELAEVREQINGWYKAGTAAGNIGDYYHNHDHHHIDLAWKVFPQLTRIEYGETTKQKISSTGAQTQLLFTGRVVGNSSTAYTQGPYWRSQSRHLYVDAEAVQRLYAQYIRNHLYLYPEHRDHDPGHNGKGGHGDVFAANTPYVTTSQGSSGSERLHMHAFVAALAAFHPETKRRLTDHGLIAPTLQMIMRRCLVGVDDDEAYLSGRAHPTVFDAKQLRPAEMVRMAHEMTVEVLPPVARVTVIEEDLGTPGIDYFETEAREQLFDTPGAIARIHRTVARERRMLISGEASYDLDERPLTWRWVILRGDPERIQITPRNEAGSVAELRIGWHERMPIEPGAKLESNRVDIGLFVRNGSYWSVPALITTFYLDNEVRVHDDAGAIQSVTYTGADEAGNYTDPRLSTLKSWQDIYEHVDGKIVGWTRQRGDASERFLADGRLVTPDGPRAVRYVIKSVAGKALPTLQQEIVHD